MNTSIRTRLLRFSLASLTLIVAASAHAQPALSADEEARIQLNVETALYRQSFLLAQELAPLKASEPGRINLYFIGVGGDGSQEVFRREIEYVRKEFDTQWGTQGRSVVLANSRTDRKSVV